MIADYLRKKHRRFVYESYDWKIKGKDLEMSFSFLLEPDIRFHPYVRVKDIDKKRIAMFAKNGTLDNFVFHLGLAEIPSYWKAAASPIIEIKAGYIDHWQKKWWEKLIAKGMGEYFYANHIDFKKPSFLTIANSPGPSSFLKIRNPDSSTFRNRILIPMGGGKDSIVTLEVLRRKFKVRCFSLNPTKRISKIISLSKTENPIIVDRTIDPALLTLNARGYLNGHTPFSSYLAFISTFCALLFDYRFIALSNERSSNEGNVTWQGSVINHQYSKSYEFEKDFRAYAKRYLSSSIEYFSFMRPLNELQIGRAFAQCRQYFPFVLSCNKGQKIGKWCGACSKCLFVYVILYPFVGHAALFKMFRSNLLQKKELFPILEELSGTKRHKPFDCVGTKEEVRKALSLGIRSCEEKKHPLPILFLLAKSKILSKSRGMGDTIHAWTNQHALPKKFVHLVRVLHK